MPSHNFNSFRHCLSCWLVVLTENRVHSKSPDQFRLFSAGSSFFARSVKLDLFSFYGAIVQQILVAIQTLGPDQFELVQDAIQMPNIFAQ